MKLENCTEVPRLSEHDHYRYDTEEEDLIYVPA